MHLHPCPTTILTWNSANGPSVAPGAASSSTPSQSALKAVVLLWMNAADGADRDDAPPPPRGGVGERVRVRMRLRAKVSPSPRDEGGGGWKGEAQG